MVNKRVVVDLAKYLLAVGLLVYVIYANWGKPGSNGLGDVWQRHVVEGQPIHVGFLLAGVALITISFLLTILRWYFLVRAQDLPFTVPDAMRLGLIGFFFNSFLPGSVGGDIIKAAFLAREQSRRTVAVATVIMDRVIALWGLIWFVAVFGTIFWLTGNLAGAVAERSKGVVVMASIVVGISVLVWIVMGFLPQKRAEIFAGRLQRIPRVGGSAAEFWRAVWMYRCRPGSVYRTMLLSWVAQSGFVMAFWCCAQVLWDGQPGAIPGLAEHFLLVPIGLVIQAVIPLPGGVGAGEFSFGKLYLYFGGAEASGVLAALVKRIIEWCLGLVGYLVYLRLRSKLPGTSPAMPVAPNSVNRPLTAGVGEG